MAIELATGYVSLTASAKGIGKSIQGELEGPLAKSGTNAGKAASKNFGSSLKAGMGNVEGVGQQAGDKVAKGFGGRLSSGLSSLPIGPALLGGAAIGSAVKFAINAASALQESISKTDAVFKGNAAEVKKWADTASTSFGQSKQQALEAASTFGNLFQAFGVGLQPATEMSTTLTKLASDLASFNNTSVQEAVEAIRSGLSGETEPLKRYGVALTDARLKQEALGLGLISDVKQPLDAAAKSQAAYALIMKDTSLAQGDFARTADGYANTMRTLQATVSEAAAELGTQLLPTLSKLAQIASKVITIVVDVKTKEEGKGGVSGFFDDALATATQSTTEIIDNFWAHIKTGTAPWEDVDKYSASAQKAAAASAVLSDEMGRVSRGFASATGGVAGYAALQQQVNNANNNVADSVSMATAGVRTYGQSLRDANTALQETLNLQLAQIDSAFGVTAATNSFITANEAAATAADDLNTGVNEQQVAYDNATQAAIAAAASTVAYAEDQQGLERGTMDAKAAQDIMIGTLQKLASQSSGPVAAAIQSVISKLQEAGKQKPKPDLDVNDKASPKVDSAKGKLSAFAGAHASGSIDLDTGRFNAALDRAYARLRNLRLQNVGTFGLAGGARNWRGGWTMVGEKGPELVNLPAGSDVYTAAQTEAMIGTGSAVAAPAQAVVISGNTFIGSGPEVTRLLSAKITEGRRAGVQFLGT